MTVKEMYDFLNADYNDLLRRVPKEELVAGFLKKYLESGEFEKMIEAFEKKDYRGLFAASHNLKGMSANMSLTRITKNITEICEAVRHGDPTVDLTDNIRQAKEDNKQLAEYVKLL